MRGWPQQRHMKDEDEDEDEKVHRRGCSKLEQVNKQKQTGREGEGLKRHVRMKGAQDKNRKYQKIKGTQRKNGLCLVYKTRSLRLVNCPKYEFVVSPLVCVLILCLVQL